MKVFFPLLIAVALFVITVSVAQAVDGQDSPPQVLFINQVRGTECCSPGSIEYFKSQIVSFEESQFPAGFALRSDALSDEVLLSVISNARKKNPKLDFGVLFEITPELARKADVQYQGSPENWYQAAHAFTLGYTPDERIKIADTLMTQYKQVFGSYPKFVSAWMIDTPTMNYLATKYGVTLLEITREQWGTDSYTLHGGPEHYPYVPSKQWLFTPSQNQENSAAYLVTRQTVSDPVLNYADFKGRFTSQPNDYMSDGKDFTYFQKLLEQALFQQPRGQRGFALLGLENSMEEKYQNEYVKQIQFISQLQKQGKLAVITPAEVRLAWHSSNHRIYRGVDISDSDTGLEVFWITTPAYQLRVVKNQNILAIEDYKIFDQNLSDPYATASAKLHAYWIQPSILDTLRQLQMTGENYLETIISQRALLRKTSKLENRHQLVLAVVDENAALLTTTQPDSIVAMVGDKKITFTDTGIQMDNFNRADFKYVPDTINLPLDLATSEGGLRITWKNNAITTHGIQLECASSECKLFQQSATAELEKARLDQPEWFLPESNQTELSEEKTKAYVNNPYTILGELPTRIVFIPQNAQGQAVSLDSLPIFDLPTALTLASPSASMMSQHVQFYDFDASESGSYTVVLKSGGHDYTLQLQVAPNCTSDWRYCVVHPIRGFWWLRAKMDNKWRLLSDKSQN